MKKIITAQPPGVFEYLNILWQFRALIIVFAKRDIKVKYAQTLLGFSWTILQPLTGLLIFTFFFGYILKWEAEKLPYSLYVLTGLLGWNFFSYIVYQGAASVQESSQLIKKIYFPKAVLPLSKVLVALLELSISFLLIVPLLLWHDYSLSWRIIFIPFILIFNALIGLFLVFLTTSLSYRFRDLNHLLPFVMYFGVWLTPVFFTKHILPETLRYLWYFNPMASVVEAWRWSLFSVWQFDILFLPAMLVIIPLCSAAFNKFIKSEQYFSDYV